jgi:hypothetical protein
MSLGASIAKSCMKKSLIKKNWHKGEIYGNHDSNLWVGDALFQANLHGE